MTALEPKFSVAVSATPSRITAGGTVLLTAEPSVIGTYDVTWIVEGPAVWTDHDVRIVHLGATTVTGNRVVTDAGNPTIRATLDTGPLAVGPWVVEVALTPVSDDGDGPGPEATVRGTSDPFEVLPRPFGAGDDVAVTLKRTAVPPTSDQALWVAIRKSTNAIGFENYTRFMDAVLCDDDPDDSRTDLDIDDVRRTVRKVSKRTGLPFPNVDRYRLLKAATEVFLMVHCGADVNDFSRVDLGEESRRLNREVDRGDLRAEMRSYLDRVATGDGNHLEVLPYLGLIRRQLGDVFVTGGDDDRTEVCYGIIAERLTNPCFIELIWSYWLDASGMMQALGAITHRFQNRFSNPARLDPLAGMEIDPLRPLSNLLWGWIRDAQHRLNVDQRAYEYDHGLGMVLASRRGRPVRGVDSRVRFVEAFHVLMASCAEFYDRDDDTTVIADGFRVLNALKETHHILSQGAHNQYGDLPFTARHEMLMAQWLLSRPEMREFLPTRAMVVEPEAWISRVEAMNQLQGWTDVAVLHFRDLAVFGEQLLLGIRFGAWTTVNEPEQAANWARYWRSEVQRYSHAYRAVTGVDLTRRAEATAPAYLRARRG